MDYTGRIITKNPQTPSANGAPGVWTLDEAMQYSKQGKWPPGYQISRSVRLRSSASAYFNRTLSTPTNNKIWTFSCWFKRGQLTYGASGASGALFFAPSSGSTFAGIYFTPTDIINWYDASGGAGVYLLQTTQVFRDPSAWYHLVCAYDSTQATASDRQKMYINGSLITALATTSYVAQNTNGRFNSAVSHTLGEMAAGPQYFDGYMTEVNFIDGQALTPTSFGYFDTYTSVWQPAPYTGTYGNNGFYLTFADNSAATAAAIGKDYSGNGNNWTPNNISVTAGATYDSMVDVPINWGTDTGVGGVVRGNYATLNPLANGTAAYVKAGNLQINPSDGNFQPSLSTIGVSSGKWYAECTVTNVGTGFVVGIDKLPSALVATQQLGQTSTSWGWYGDGTNTRLYNNGSYTSYGTTYTTGAVISIALDMDAGTLVFYRNGVSQGTATTGLSGTYAIGASPAGAAGIADMNYGQRPFVYTAPSGYKALCTQNISVPTVLNGASYMAATLYTGNGSTGQSITNTVNGISFAPDFVWVKSRSNVQIHGQYDRLRYSGSSYYYLASDTTNAELTGNFSSLNSDGWTFNGATHNTSGATYVGWQWKGGGAGVTNTAGSITSTVSASTTAGFSVVTYTGTGANATVGHGLGVAPSMIIVKSRSPADWYVGHTSIGWSNTGYLILNNTGASGQYGSVAVWQSTAPTSTIITLGTASGVNASAGTYVAYCFASITGYSAFGSYTGNGSTDGPFVYCGFRPRYLWIKRTNSTGNWIDLDTSRSTYNSADAYLSLNASSAEATGAYNTDILSNGFKLRYADPYGDVNASGSTYIYAAFAENPFTIARAR